jgi:hypothetical protein
MQGGCPPISGVGFPAWVPLVMASHGQRDPAKQPCLTSATLFPMSRPLLASILLVTLAGGCAYQSPRLKVTDIKVTERSEAGIVLKVAVEAENRNEVELPLREIRYKVGFAGGPSYTGVRSGEASLRRLGTQTLTFPAVIPLAAGEPVPEGLLNVEVSGDLSYIAPGELSKVLYDTGIRRPSKSFSGAAAIDFGR